MAEVLGTPVSDLPLTREQDAAALSGAGLDGCTVGCVVGLAGDTHYGLLGETTGDLARLIGRPSTPLSNGLRAGR